MPAASQAQQRLMAQAYQVWKWKDTGGKEGIDPLDIDARYRVEIEDLAASMKPEDLKTYAETKHDELPHRVKESSMTGFLSAGPFPKFASYANNIAGGIVASERDRQDSLVQSFMEFVDGKKKDTEKDQVKEAVAAMTPPGVAQTSNTPGMGNVVPPSQGNVGSGDKFDNDEENDEDRIGIMNYEDYKKWVKKWLRQNHRK